MPALDNKHILLGVSGGIAAYKSPDLVRRLSELGADVRVVMTHSAQAFVTPLTFQASSGNPVHTDLLDEAAEAGMGHIELARWADAILIAPASANRIAAMAHGCADDLLSTICLASEAPLFVAPAMNRVMWKHAAVQQNVATLRQRGATILGPGNGDQACGETGLGRMLEPAELRDSLLEHFATNTNLALAGKRVLITAGPTREALDPVRYIGNHSSGKMGFAVAAAAANCGAQVIMVAGPVEQPTPPTVERVDVISAAEMHSAVMSHIQGIDIFIAVAAVADYRARTTRSDKIKKSAELLSIELEPNPDILHEVATLKKPPFTVGFAAETHDVENYARAKLHRKNLNMIAANQVGGQIGGKVGEAESGFASDNNSLLVLNKDGSTHLLENAPKTRIAAQLLELIAEQVANK